MLTLIPKRANKLTDSVLPRFVLARTKTFLVFAHPSTDRAKPTRAKLGTDRLRPKLEH
jgi:hypothetical protein